MRPIDADDFRKRMDMICDAGGYLQPITEAVREYVKIMIDRQPTVEAEPDKGWISVKDRLPENDGLYIVCKTVKGHQISFEAHWKGNKWLSVVKNNQLDYVTHWMPLPEPPKGEWLWTSI